MSAKGWLTERKDDLSRAAQEFIQASAAREQRRARNRLVTASIVALLLAAVSWVAFNRWQGEMCQRRIARSSELSEKAKNALEREPSYPQRSLLLAVEALNVTWSQYFPEEEYRKTCPDLPVHWTISQEDTR